MNGTVEEFAESGGNGGGLRSAVKQTLLYVAVEVAGDAAKHARSVHYNLLATDEEQLV